MKKLKLTFLILTLLFIALSFKIKDDYFYLPYPNAIEYVLALLLLIITLTSLLWRKHRKLKAILGVTSIAILFLTVTLLNSLFEWHPLLLSLPFTKSQSFEVNHKPFMWQTATPASMGYKEEKFQHFLSTLKDWQRLRALVVIKEDQLMVEKYQSGATPNSAFNVHSITKSITSALVGLSLQKGVLQSEKAFIMPFFAQYRKEAKDKDAKEKISISHLLSMQAGFTGADGPQSVAQTLLKEKVAEQNIGTRFKYFTASHMLLSAVLTQANGIATKDFAQKELFNPLGINCGFWRKVDGYYCGGDETYFTARDLARFGTLYLNKGKVNGRVLLDSTWVEKSLANYSADGKAFRQLDCYKEVGYGYSWWQLQYNGQIIYTARGKGGQYILILPEQKVVAVILQEWNLQKDFKKENGYLCRLLSLLTNKN